MKKPLLFAALSRRVAGITEQAQLYFDTIRRTPVVVTPAGELLPLENRSAKGVAGGYASLDSSTLVPIPQLGTGTPTGSKFLRDDRTWAVPGGGGVTDHALLTSLDWASSGHTSTADRLAGFSGAGAAVAASVSAPLAYGSSALSLSGWSGTTDGDMLYRNGTAVGSKTPAQARTWLDLATYYQPVNGNLSALAGLTSAADKLPYYTGSGTAALADFSGFARTLLDDANAAAARSTLGLAIGTDVQAYDADLTGLAGLGNGLPVRSAGTWAVGTISAPLSLSGSTLSVAAATTTAAGVVELANDGEETAGLAVQASDSRLAASPSLWSQWGHVQPRGTVSPPSYDGRGALSAQGIHSVSVAEPNFPAFRLGDTAANACRFTIVGAFRLDEGSWTIDYVFKLGSDISATQSCWIGMFNGTTLDSADPATSQRAALRYAAGTDTNWSISTKDGTTPNNVDSGVAVTASYYYVVRLRLTTTTYTAQIGRGSTLADAILDFASFTPVANNSNLPGSTTDLQIVSSCYRASVATANRSIISGPMLWRCDL